MLRGKKKILCRRLVVILVQRLYMIELVAFLSGFLWFYSMLVVSFTDDVICGGTVLKELKNDGHIEDLHQQWETCGSGEDHINWST